MNNGRANGSSAVTVNRADGELNLLSRVRGEFREMPGMRLSLDQAMRLWALDYDTCRSLLDTLMASKFLVLDGHGRYGLAHGGY